MKSADNKSEEQKSYEMFAKGGVALAAGLYADDFLRRRIMPIERSGLVWVRAPKGFTLLGEPQKRTFGWISGDAKYFATHGKHRALKAALGSHVSAKNEKFSRFYRNLSRTSSFRGLRMGLRAFPLALAAYGAATMFRGSLGIEAFAPSPEPPKSAEKPPKPQKLVQNSQQSPSSVSVGRDMMAAAIGGGAGSLAGLGAERGLNYLAKINRRRVIPKTGALSYFGGAGFRVLKASARLLSPALKSSSLGRVAIIGSAAAMTFTAGRRSYLNARAQSDAEKRNEGRPQLERRLKASRRQALSDGKVAHRTQDGRIIKTSKARADYFKRGQ